MQKSTPKKTPAKKEPEKKGTAAKGKTPSRRAPKPAWVFEEPSADKLLKPKMWGDKMWYYCSKKTGGKCAGQYCRHKPLECEGKAHVFTPSVSKRKASPNTNTAGKKALKLAQAYQAATKESKDTSSDDSS
jgi:hypothetical protein